MISGDRLRDQTLSGFVWNFVGTFGYGILNIVITIILARLLTPTDFGMVEIVMVFVSISEVFVDSGFSQALIRNKYATERDFTSVFYLNLLIALTLYLLLFFLSPTLSGFFESPSLNQYARVLFLVILFNSCSLIQNTIFSKDLKFKPIAIASISAILIAGTSAVLIALNGGGIWALIANLTIYSLIRMIILWTMGNWHPKGGISMDSIKKYFAVGGNLLFQGIADKISTNAESFLIGKIYSKSLLGYFSQARKLDSYLTQTLTSIIQRVSFPALSKIDSNQALLNAYRSVLRVAMYVIVPMTIFIIASTDSLIVGIYGSQWLPTADFLKIWSICGLLVSYYSIFINIFIVKGETRKLLHLSLLRQFLRIVAVIGLISFNMKTLLVGIVIVTFIASIFYSHYGGELIGYNFKRISSDLQMPILTSVTAGLAVFLLSRLFLPTGGFPALLTLSINFVVMFATYILLNQLFHTQSHIEFWNAVQSIIRKIRRPW